MMSLGKGMTMQMPNKRHAPKMVRIGLLFLCLTGIPFHHVPVPCRGYEFETTVYLSGEAESNVARPPSPLWRVSPMALNRMLRPIQFCGP